MVKKKKKKKKLILAPGANVKRKLLDSLNSTPLLQHVTPKLTAHLLRDYTWLLQKCHQKET